MYFSSLIILLLLYHSILKMWTENTCVQQYYLYDIVKYKEKTADKLSISSQVTDEHKPSVCAVVESIMIEVDTLNGLLVVLKQNKTKTKWNKQTKMGKWISELRPAWSTELVLGQTGLHRGTLPWKSKTKNQTKPNRTTERVSQLPNGLRKIICIFKIFIF